MRRGSPVDSELPRRLWDFISHNAPLFWHWTTHDPVAFYSFVLSISTIALWFVTWRGLRNQTCETRILQRAYVSVEPGGIRPHVDRPDRVNCYVIFRNVGHLPARNVRWYGKSGRPETHGNGDDDFVLGDLFPGRIVLAPGSLSCQPVGVVFAIRWPDLKPEQVVGNSVFVGGIVTYEDGFGTPRFTRFCHRYITKTIPNDGAFTMSGELADLHEYGNDAD
jgi:hypothetical protein